MTDFAVKTTVYNQLESFRGSNELDLLINIILKHDTQQVLHSNRPQLQPQHQT